MKYLILLLVTFNVFASTAREVLIRGKIANEFNEKKVKVIDTEGQIYFLSRHLFPKDMKFKQGQSFAIEVNEKEINNIKFLKK